MSNSTATGLVLEKPKETSTSKAAKPPTPRQKPPRTASRNQLPLPERRRRKMVAAAVVVSTVFVGRMVQIQIVEAPALAATALEGRMSTSSVPAHRGQITDRNGLVLATSADRYTLAADQQAMLGFRGNGHVDATGKLLNDGPLGVAQLLAPLLDADPNELGAKLNGTSRYRVLARDVSPEKQREIRKLNLQAYVSSELTSQRQYPVGALTGPIVGYVDNEQVGQGGIERAYQDLLAGTPGTEEYERGRDGVPIPGGVREISPAITGGDVVLTIDQRVQWKAKEELDKAVSNSGAAYGFVVVKDIKTGELLALADSGSVDPNDRSSSAVASGSRVVQDTFEPGSTGKIITMAAALETGVYQPDSQFVVPYLFTTPNGQKFHDSHEHPTQHLTLTGILATSSNSGTVQVAEKIPPEVQYEYLKKFGLGEYSGLGLAGESRGRVHPWEKWDGRTRYTVAFGQGLTVNALQATNVYSTVANNGVSVPAKLVLGTREATSNELVPTPTQTGEQVISPETAHTLMAMLEQVTSDDGTAKAAQIPGYRVAGKTGTAQIAVGQGKWTFMASFIGVAPADDPRYVVSVFLKSPHSSIFGGVIAAPVFREVMGFTLSTYAVPTSTTETEPLATHW